MDYTLLEQLAKEKQEILNGEAYQKGRALLRYKSLIHNRDFKNLKKDLHDFRAARTIRKKYMNHLDRPEKECRNLDITRPRIAVYTCVTGNYDNLPKPLCSFENVDFILFTDHPENYREYEDVFKIQKMEDEVLKRGNILANRFIKFHPSRYLKDDYDFAIYMDGNVRVMGDIRTMINRIPEDTGIAMHNHRERDDVYSEAEVCKLLRRGDPKKIDTQMLRYRNAGLAGHFGMNEATVIASDLHNEKACGLLDAWWEEFLKSDSYRDQLAWPFVLFENNIFIEEIGNLGNDIYRNPKLEIVRHA